MNITKLTNLIFEAQHLKQIKHEGWRLAGIPNPDSVAEHSLNATQIGYILAKMEGVDENKVIKMLIWHDIAETRIGDIHKVGARYIDNKEAIEEKIIDEQFEGLEFADEIKSYFREFDERKTLEAQVAKEADYLEQAFQAKIYVENGYKHAQNWIDNVGKAMTTKSGKKLWKEMTKISFSDRWEKNGLQKLKGTN